METFLRKYGSSVIGFLSGFDRMLFRGTLRNLCTAQLFARYLSFQGVLLKDYGAYVNAVTARVKDASLAVAKAQNRPIQHLPCAGTRKDETARQIARRDGITQGLVCVLTALEPCLSFDVRGNHLTHRLEVVSRQRKCLHFYHYWIDPVLGFMHGRLQTWFPFSIQVWLNGREQLTRALTRAGVAYRSEENCVTWAANLAKAQQLLAQQTTARWEEILTPIAARLNPIHAEIFGDFLTHYYWSLAQSEWATDVLFRERAELQRLYPRFLRHGLATFSSPAVMRFLGRKLTATGAVHGQFTGEIKSDLRHRPEGVRLKHWVNQNSIKIYDKRGKILRVETTINNPYDFKAFRRPEGNRRARQQWLPLRRGIADLPRRAAVSQAANARYLEALAVVDDGEALGELARPLSRAVIWKGERQRGFNLWGDDADLLTAIGRGEYLLNGFRNRDLRQRLYPDPAATPEAARRTSGRITRKLRLLRAHGLIRKIPHTHRYQVTEKGRRVIAALAAARDANVAQLTQLAA